MLAEYLRHVNQPEKAIEVLGTDLDKLHATGTMILGDAYVQTGRYEEAREAFVSVREANPGILGGWLRSAGIEELTGQYDNALDIVNQPEVLEGVVKKEALFREYISAINEKYAVFEEVRGQGMLLGCALNEKYQGRARDFMMAATQEHLMCLVAGANVIRFAPSLVIPDEDIKEGLARFERAVAAVVNAE